MKNVRDEKSRSYHNLYNRVDFLLLADVFENLRDICIKNYNLDPAHYHTAPRLAWDAALQLTSRITHSQLSRTRLIGTLAYQEIDEKIDVNRKSSGISGVWRTSTV